MVSCLLLLQGKRRMTARALGEMLGVSTRTVYRDVEALCVAGVPIHMERGSLGGIVLADDYRRALAQFGTDEVHALFAAGPGPLGDLGLPARSFALQKLAGALPAVQRRAAETSRQRLLVDHNRWSRGEQPTDVLLPLRRASEHDRRVAVRYRDRTGAFTTRTLDALGLVAKAGVWYLIAREPAKGYRTFRVQRIAEVAVLDETFVRPLDFDLEAYWNESVTSIERQSQDTFDVVVRIAAEARTKVTPFWDCSVVVEDDVEMTLRIAFPSRDVAIAQLLVLAASVLEIASPDGLGDAIVAGARVAIARYTAPAITARPRIRS